MGMAISRTATIELSKMDKRRRCSLGIKLDNVEVSI